AREVHRARAIRAGAEQIDVVGGRLRRDVDEVGVADRVEDVVAGKARWRPAREVAADHRDVAWRAHGRVEDVDLTGVFERAGGDLEVAGQVREVRRARASGVMDVLGDRVAGRRGHRAAGEIGLPG